MHKHCTSEQTTPFILIVKSVFVHCTNERTSYVHCPIDIQFLCV
uniref:Uncharacterized protein n=1 Tax=Arundo donax TaxID=35708 RepID=A0A0A9A249_ARUDO